MHANLGRDQSFVMEDQAERAMRKRWVPQAYQLRKAAKLEDDEDFCWVVLLAFLVVLVCL